MILRSTTSSTIGLILSLVTSFHILPLSNAFLTISPFVPNSIITLQAKNTNNKKGRKRNKANDSASTSSKAGGKQRKNSSLKIPPPSIKVPKKPPLKKHVLSLNNAIIPTANSTQPQLFQVVAYQVEDPTWWQQANDALVLSNSDSSNPFGAKLWPSAWGVAQFMALMQDDLLSTYQVLELGCGGGLCSIAAAHLGAHVMASDISQSCLDVTQQGWTATRKLLVNNNNNSESNQQCISADDKQQPSATARGSLQTLQLDLFAKQPLPLPLLSSSEHSALANNATATTSTTQKTMVVAAAMLYSSDLATILARRAFEAIHFHDAWVMIGDDDSGEREGGRQIFFEELDRLQVVDSSASPATPRIERRITNSTVQNKALKWSAKQIQVIHLNPPADIILDVDLQ